MQFAVIAKKLQSIEFLNHNTPFGLGPNCAADVGQTPHSTGASATKLQLTAVCGLFHVSWLKNTLRFKAFEDEKRSNVTPHGNFCRCIKRTTGGASSNEKASAIS